MRLRTSLMCSIWICIIVLISVSTAGVIQGRIIEAETGNPIEGALVFLKGTSRSTSSDTLGEYSFKGVEKGTYSLNVRHQDYGAFNRHDIYVPADRKVRVDAELKKEVFQLDRMVVQDRVKERGDAGPSSSTYTINRDELRRAPGALADVQRIVQNLPGVVSGSDNLNEVIVRGGLPGENLFVMDNIELRNPNHFGDRGSGGGVIAVLNPLLVDNVVFNPGPLPAEYGGKASSVIDIDMRDGNREMFLGGLDISFAGAGIHTEGPLWPGGSFIASARRSYLDFVSEFAPGTAIPKYWGVQGKVTHEYKNGSLYLNGIGGQSDIEIKDASAEYGFDTDRIRAGSDLYGTGVSWEHNLNKKTGILVSVSASGNLIRSTDYDSSGNQLRYDSSYQNTQGLKAGITLNRDSKAEIKAGFHGKRLGFDLERFRPSDTLQNYSGDSAHAVEDSLGDPVYRPVFKPVSNYGYEAGGYISGQFKWFKGLSVRPGLRISRFTMNSDLYLDPRLLLEYMLPSGSKIHTGFGIQHQQPDSRKLLGHRDNRDLESKRSISGTVGMSHDWPDKGFRLKGEVFYKAYNNINIDYARLENDSVYKFLESYRLDQSGEGKSYGLELYSEKELTDIFFYSAALTLSRSFYRFERINSGSWYPGDYDNRYAITLTGGAKLELNEREWYKKLSSKIWFKLLSPVIPFADRQEFSFNFKLRGGRPYSEHVYDYDTKRWMIDNTAPNSERGDTYHRLDFRWERRYGFGRFHIIYYWEIQNLYNRENTWQYLYQDGKDTPVKIRQLPFFPAGGVIMGF
ncbi:MAG: TonB-dependent receptor [Chitinivibrionales bacterium]